MKKIFLALLMFFVPLISYATNYEVTTPGNNVGIGTVTPGTALDVNGTVRTTGFTLGGVNTTGMNGTGNICLTTNCALTTPNLGTPSAIVLTNATGTASGLTAGNVTTNANLTGAVTSVGNATSNNLTANIGIGSANPGQALDVIGVVRSSGGFQAGTGAGAIVGLGSSGNIGINSTTPSGFVGIGTMFPGVNLDVNGTVRMTGITITTGVLANGNVLVANNVGIGSWMPPSTIGASGGGSGTVNSGTINQFAYYASSTTAVSTQTPLSTDNTNIGVGTTGPSSLFDVNRKFNVLSSGNVGIGSLAPGQALDVNGTVRAIGFISTGSANTTFGTNVGIGTFTTNQLTVNGGVSIDTANGQYVQTVAPAGGMLIHGNVGIGTGMASPPTLLSIGGKCLGLAGDMYLNASGSVCVCTSGSFPACASSVCC